jgi:hypothetical protein
MEAAIAAKDWKAVCARLPGWREGGREGGREKQKEK